MKTYSYTPKQQNRRAAMILAIFAACLAVTTVAIVLQMGIRLVNEILFLIFAAALVFVMIKHFFTSYTYTITLLGGIPVLIVTQKQGGRMTTVYHQELSALSELHEHGRSAENPRDLRVDIRYRYCVTLSPERWQSLYFILKDGQCVSVSLEADDDFLYVLREALAFMHKRLDGERADEELAARVFQESAESDADKSLNEQI